VKPKTKELVFYLTLMMATIHWVSNKCVMVLSPSIVPFIFNLFFTDFNKISEGYGGC
jgi:hypothetical protein